jgi:hypothetical protein
VPEPLLQALALAALLDEPTRATEVPAEHVPALLRQVSAAQHLLAVEQHRLAVVEGNLADRLTTLGAAPDRLLTAEDAAALLAVSVDWLRRRADLPFVVRPSEGLVRYSARGIAEYIARRMGKPAC